MFAAHRAMRHVSLNARRQIIIRRVFNMPVVTTISQAFLTSLSSAFNLLLTFIPRFVGFLIILLLGWIIASLLSRAVGFVLKKLGFERLDARIGLDRLLQNTGMRLDSITILGRIVY